MHLDDVRDILRGGGPLEERLLRLQGLRGEDLTQGLAAGWAVRVGPAACGVMALAAGVSRSAPAYGVLAAVAVSGALLPNHPVELAFGAWARRRGRVPQPANRAARRAACLAGAGFFALAAWGLSGGPPLLFPIAGTTMVVLPAFVALTNLCVPSLVFTVLFGADAGAAPTLGSCVRRPARPAAVVS